MKKCILEKRHQELGEKYGGNCIICGKKIGLSFQEILDKNYKDLITEDMKNDFIKSIRNGKTIGEATKEANIPEHEHQTLFTGKIIFEREKMIRYLDLGEGKIVF